MTIEEFLQRAETRRILGAYMPSVWAGDESEVTDEECDEMVDAVVSRLLESLLHE